MQKLKKLVNRVIDGLSSAQWVGPLVVRISIGWIFYVAGGGKLEHLDNVTSYFDSLGIPAPGLNAAVAAAAEYGCGLLVIVGLGTRFSSLILAFVMLVALGTEFRPKIANAFGDGFGEGLGYMISLTEFVYLAAFLWLAVAGPGKASLDHLIARKLRPASSPE